MCFSLILPSCAIKCFLCALLFTHFLTFFCSFLTLKVASSYFLTYDLPFSGIPGCAKSALCKELLNAPGGFGDDRPVQSLMGDLIKGTNFPENFVHSL